MTVYLDLYFLLNFFFDLFVLAICRQLLGYRKRPLRLLAAALLGACYSVAALFTTPPFAMLLHLAFGVLMLLIACGFGTLRRFLRLMLLFFGVCFLLGGAVTALARGLRIFKSAGSYLHLTVCAVLISALIGGAVCLFWGRITLVRPGERTATVTLRHGQSTLCFQAYADSGNMLRDPLEHTPVILANAALSRKIYALFTDAPPPTGSLPDPAFYEGMPLRLIPCDSVGGRVMLAGLKFTDAVIKNEERSICIALDFSRSGDYCGCEALLPAAIL